MNAVEWSIALAKKDERVQGRVKRLLQDVEQSPVNLDAEKIKAALNEILDEKASLD